MRPTYGRVTHGAVEYGMVSVEQLDNIFEPIVLPNPVKSTFFISFDMLKASLIRVELIDITGVVIKKIFNGYLLEGAF